MERVKGLIFFVVLLSGLALGDSPKAEPAIFSKVIRANLVFEAPSDELPHIKIYLRLVNDGDADIIWICNTVFGIEAQMFDSLGRPVHEGSYAASIQSNNGHYLLSHGSRMDWLISHGGMSGTDPSGKLYAFEVGGHIWWIPKDSVGSYSLKVRLMGEPWPSSDKESSRLNDKLLLDLPPQKIIISH